ncbi:primosome, DnaD subunit [Mesobacillus campisalis]|uniref:Primosome, DnaD subunit n=1 Tax=Mesobacillus campisalis TaxID=1408103 RepID=A0A0M2T412_9BACI|nr:DnaD domain protein [Mesobacillus campisalis]KKK39997.1 primosome, DnaD subunit [Mesobacillus campisalis]
MAKYRMVQTGFWKNPVVSEEMTPEDRYFYLYLLTNPNTTQSGIYKITKKQMAFDLGYSIESVHSLMERFIHHHQLIRYNPDTREIAIKNWAKENIHNGGKPVMDCICSELKEVEDLSLIQYVAEPIQKQDVRSLYLSFCAQEEIHTDEQGENYPYITQGEEGNDTLPRPQTIRGQKEKENKKEKKQQKDFYPSIENNPDIESSSRIDFKNEDVQEIIAFWDNNGFGFSNVNAKQQLLAWLEDSRFLHPKAVILKALEIACSNNKRKLNYVVGILKNWENESLLSVEEIDACQENHNLETKVKASKQSSSAGRAIPGEFKLDLTEGEES